MLHFKIYRYEASVKKVGRTKQRIIISQSLVTHFQEVKNRAVRKERKPVVIKKRMYELLLLNNLLIYCLLTVFKT